MITQSTCFSANGLLSVGKKKQLYWFFKFWLVCLQKSNVLFIRLAFFSLQLTRYTKQFIIKIPKPAQDIKKKLSSVSHKIIKNTLLKTGVYICFCGKYKKTREVLYSLNK
ncbi:MAG: hypothetical protein ACJA1Z_000356 [Patiriisocius sp.]|jgi:hypothetical protein